MVYLYASLLLAAETEHMKYHLQTKHPENMLTEKIVLHYLYK